MPDLSFPNNNNNTIIRPFVAGENITQGQILTQHQGLARINKRRNSIETISSLANAFMPFTAMCAINPTQALVAFGTSVAVVTTANDGTAPSLGTLVPLASYTGTSAVPMSINKITSNTFLIIYSYTNEAYGVVATISGTTVSLGTALLLGGPSVSSLVSTVISSTLALVVVSNSSASATILLSINGTALTVSSSTSLFGTTNCPLSAPTNSVLTLAVISPTQVIFTPNVVGSDCGIFIFTISGVTVTVAELNLLQNNIFGESVASNAAVTFNSVFVLDSTHLLLSTTTGGVCIGTLNASYTTLTLGQIVVPIGEFSNTKLIGWLTQLDTTHYLFYSLLGSCVVTVSNIGSEWSIAVGYTNTFQVSALVSPTCITYCGLSSNNALLSIYTTYSVSVQDAFIIGDSVNDYSLNLGIAMNSASSGGAVNVLMAGSSTSIYTGLISGAKYSNLDGVLTLGSAPNHVITPGTVTSGQAFPTYDADVSARYPYAIALGATEIQILESMNMRGVMY
jgi:hypothetical protein